MGGPIVLGEKSFNRITQNKKTNGLNLKAEHPTVCAEAQTKQAFPSAMQISDPNSTATL